MTRTVIQTTTIKVSLFLIPFSQAFTSETHAVGTGSLQCIWPQNSLIAMLFYQLAWQSLGNRCISAIPDAFTTKVFIPLVPFL